jgi:hypothetical protein
MLSILDIKSKEQNKSELKETKNALSSNIISKTP